MINPRNNKAKTPIYSRQYFKFFTLFVHNEIIHYYFYSRIDHLSLAEFPKAEKNLQNSFPLIKFTVYLCLRNYGIIYHQMTLSLRIEKSFLLCEYGQHFQNNISLELVIGKHSKPHFKTI